MMVNVKSGFEPRKVANEILFKYAMDYNLDMIMTKNMFSGISSRLNAFSYVAFGVAGLLWITALGVLALVFSMIVNERKREFGLLRILGASRKKLNRILLTESLMVSTGGALCGLFLACLVLFPFSTLISMAVKLPFLLPAYGKMAGMALFSLILSVGIGPLSCFYSVCRLGRMDISFALRGNGSC